jgi:hypothetical protein
MCFSFMWVIQLLIWLVVICAVIALLRLAVGAALPKLGVDAEIISVALAALRIFIWAIVIIALLIFIGDLISCLAPSLSLPRMR